MRILNFIDCLLASSHATRKLIKSFESSELNYVSLFDVLTISILHFDNIFNQLYFVKLI